MNVLSLFDGMSCGQQALQRAGIPVDKYFASEIDKHAIAVTQANFPNTIQLGSVVDLDPSTLPPIDILCGGSPCQSFSFAGKRKGMSTKCETDILNLEQYLQLKSDGFEFEGQSYLFWEYMRILKAVKPTYFLLENVLMEEKWERILTGSIGVRPIMINSALVSAQNRKRLYWTNIGLKPSGLFGDLESSIQQPKDRKIILKDILEDDVPEKYYLSSKMLQYFSGGNEVELTHHYIKLDTNLKPSQNQDKANCFTAGGNSGGLHSDMTLIVTSRGRNPENTSDRTAGSPTRQHLEPRKDNKTNCLTSVSKDNLVVQLNPSKETDFLQYTENMRIRRLTPVECERLQTVEDGYTSSVSDTQRYKMLGNGWTIDVISHIFSYI